MTPNLDHIPYQALNRFYAEVVGGLHVSLRPLATDLRILRHEAVERHTSNIAQELYQPQYSYVPWMVAEFFEIDDALLLTLGKAWWLTIMDVVITDQAVDQQLPDIPTISLLLQHLRLHAQGLYLEAFGSSELFWPRYQAAIAGVWNALAHETYCVDAHQQAYSFDEMKQVCNSRSDLIGAIIWMMGHASGQPQAVTPLCTFYENLTFADQLLDDANDWKADFSSGRYTLPVILALEAEQLSLDDARQLSLDDFQLLINRHRILVRLSEAAAELLEGAAAALRTTSLSDSHLHDVLRQRQQVARRTSHRYTTTRLMSGFLKRLEG